MTTKTEWYVHGNVEFTIGGTLSTPGETVSLTEKQANTAKGAPSWLQPVGSKPVAPKSEERLVPKPKPEATQTRKKVGSRR